MSNVIQEKLRQNKHVVGPFIKLPSPAVVEIAGLAGFDFVIIDCEHGPLDMLVAEDMVRAAKLQGISPVIRVSANEEVLISRALDIGADAVQVPQIVNREDAQRVVHASKFAPLGQRGVCRYVRAADYTKVSKEKYFQKANRDTMTIIHVEGEEGVRNIDEILTVEGIDVIFLGPYDLSQSLGIPGEVNHPRVIRLMEEVIEKAGQQRKVIGTFADNTETAQRWMKSGVQYMSYAVDVGIIMDAFEKIASTLKQS